MPVIPPTFHLSSWELLFGTDQMPCSMGGTRVSLGVPRCQPPRIKCVGTLCKDRTEGEERRNGVRAGFDTLAVAWRQVDRSRLMGYRRQMSQPWLVGCVITQAPTSLLLQALSHAKVNPRQQSMLECCQQTRNHRGLCMESKRRMAETYLSFIFHLVSLKRGPTPLAELSECSFL